MDINFNKIKARVLISSKYENISDKRLITWWSKITNIPPSNFWKTKWFNAKEVYIRNRQQPSKYDELEITYYDKKLVRATWNNIKMLLNTSDLKVAVDFLKGIFAGDGFVKLRMNGKLQEVRIGAKDDKEKIAKLLQIIGIIPGKFQKWDIPIYGINNFNKVTQYNLLDLHPEKAKKFALGNYALCGGV